MLEGLSEPILVKGEVLTALPADLFIPPDALAVLLDSFSGPLDLLLYLIRKQNIDILDIPIAMISRQYLEYIAILKQRSLELAAEYLLMAAMLAEIKAKLLLPPMPTEEAEASEEDPRMELVRRLQAYEQMKLAASLLDAVPRIERDIYPVVLQDDLEALARPEPVLRLGEMLKAYAAMLGEQQHRQVHQIQRESLSVRERMLSLLQRLVPGSVFEFRQLLIAEEGRPGLVVSFLALLELSRQSLVRLTQPELGDTLYIELFSHGS